MIKSFCRILIFVALLGYNVSGVLQAKQPFSIGGTVNAGYTSFSGSWASETNGVVDFEWDNVTGAVCLFLLWCILGGSRVWVGVDSYLGTPKYTVTTAGVVPIPLVDSVVGGFRVGPYLRFGLWGKDKGGGIAVAGLFMFDHFRTE